MKKIIMTIAAVMVMMVVATVSRAAIYDQTGPVIPSSYYAAEGTASLTVDNGSTWGGTSIWIADTPGTSGTLDVLSGGTVTLSFALDVGNNPGAGQTAVLNVVDGNINTTGGGDLRLGVTSGTSTMTISGNSSVIVNDDFQMNVAGNTTATLNMNGGLLDAGWIMLEYSGSGGSSTINLNGGRIQTHEVRFLADADALIVYTGGELLVEDSTMTEAQMTTFIANGDIDVSGAAAYSVTSMTVGGMDYTALVIPEPATIGLLGVAGIGMLVVRRRLMM